MPEAETLNNPLAIVGDEDIVLGFKALGFQIYPIVSPEEFKATLEELLRNKIAICLVQENIYGAYLDLINIYRDLPLPIFIPFSTTAKTELLETIVKGIRLRATGAF